MQGELVKLQHLCLEDKNNMEAHIAKLGKSARNSHNLKVHQPNRGLR